MADIWYSCTMPYFLIILSCTLYIIGITMFLYTAAINVTKVIVNIPPSDAEQIPFVLNLQDDNIVEPVDFYQLTIVNVSDPNVIIGDINTTFIIVNDDDEVVDEEGKIYINK